MSRLESLEPEFRTKIEQLIQAAEGITGRKWVITSGRRTMAEQRKIYAQGRTTPGNIVSNAPAGHSAHNFGLAVDLCPLHPTGGYLDWNADRKLWKLMAALAEEMGLVSGFSFRTICDAPHVEDKNWRVQQALWSEGKLVVA